jgi:hypothetical protein
MVVPLLMPRTTAKKPPTKPRPKKAKPAASAADKQAKPEERSGYAAGDLVSHPTFGPGTVTAVDADKLTIKFADGQVKQIVDYYVNRRPR